MLHVDTFHIEYREDGSEQQFYSDLSILDPVSRNPISRQTIRVNKPLRFGGVTAYQTDWGIAALKLQVLDMLWPNLTTC